jgi:cytochrome c oxidase cbb3-type subunit 3
VPTKIEKDSVSGRDTTGHEWDGIKELDTPLPKWWLYTFYACIAVAFGMFLLYPSIPYGPGYWHGLMGYSQRKMVDNEVAKLTDARKVSMDKIGALSFDEIKADPALLEVALTKGKITFEENCQACHGAGGSGGPGFPALAAGSWLWGGKLADIQRTVTHGIRSGDPTARTSAMPRFGADGLLKTEEIQQIADFVWSTYYGHAKEGEDVSAGAKLFAQNCAACHGVEGQGNRLVGAPRLNSHVHLYGDAREIIVSQVNQPRQGVMPAWNARLDPATIKAVTLYVHSLGGGE